MAVTMKDVRAVLDPEEPHYSAAAQLGPDALPHLRKLAKAKNTLLASKATYLASLINHEGAVDVLQIAADRSEPEVRVQAAAAAKNMINAPARATADLVASQRVNLQAPVRNILSSLLNDEDIGVRKVALRSVTDAGMQDLSDQVESLARNDPHEAIRSLATRFLQPTTDVEGPWSKPEVYAPGVLPAENLSFTSSGNFLSVLLTGMEINLTGGGQPLSAVHTSAFRVPVSQPEDRTFVGFKTDIRGFVQKDISSRVLLTADIAGTLHIIELPYGQELEGEFTRSLFSLQSKSPAGAVSEHPLTSFVTVTLVITVERLTEQNTARVALGAAHAVHSLDIELVFGSSRLPT